MQAGDRVTVVASVVVFNHPEHRGQAFDMKGQTGEVANVLNDWKGRVISPTLPVIVGGRDGTRSGRRRLYGYSD